MTTETWPLCISFVTIESGDRKPKTNLWRLARACNLVISFGYLPLIIMSIWITIRLYYYGGKTLMNSFDINDRKLSIFVPVWYHISDNLDFGDWLNLPFMLIIFLCNIWLLNFALGFDLMMSGRTTFTCLFAIILILCTMALEGGIFYNIHGLDSAIMFNIRIKMQALIQKQYKVLSPNDLTVALNMMMVKGDCCGFSGPHDFRNVSLRAVLRKNVKPFPDVQYYEDSPPWLRMFTIPNENLDFDGVFKIPPACCTDNVSDVADPVIRFNRIVECATSDSFNYRHNVQGCFGYFYEANFPVHTRLVTISLIMFFQTIQIILIILIMVSLPIDQPPKTEGGEEEEEGYEDFEDFEEDEDDRAFAEEYMDQKDQKEAPLAGEEDEY